MANKRSFFSRLFGNAPAEGPPEDAPEQEREDVSPPPPEPDNSFLELPPEHSIYRLAGLWEAQASSLPPPEFHMAAPEALLPRGDLDRELSRLKTIVTNTAAKRADLAFPKIRDGEPPPPVDLDAQVVVFLPGNRLTAWLFAYPPVGGGKELTREMLSGALDGAGVTYGVDKGLLDSLPGQDRRYFRLYLAAKGDPVVNGKDGTIVDLFPRKVEREYKINDRGQVDYTTLNLVQNAEEGAVICRILPPTEGTNGHSVLDEELPAKDGRPAVPPKGRNTALSEDGTALVAARSGHVEFTGRTFEIKPLLEIGGNVDFSTGNINYLGDIHIHGDVCSGFTVRAMGSITVDGVVEASSVEAGGDLIVAKGVQGNDQAVIRSQRNVFVKYLENCSVYARGNLQADCIINCEVYSDGDVQVRSGRGTIIGGRIRAARTVSASIVGSKSELTTAIDLGGMPCEDFERELLQKEIHDLEEELEKTVLQPESPHKLQKLSTTRMKLSISRNKLNLFDKNSGEAPAETEEGEEKKSPCRLEFGVAYGGTEIIIGPALYRLNHETHHSSASLVNGEIQII
ncbi:MAG: DUF342 domain-containing protein [Oscillibacter sp.]|nr:DUF342 domain-containing protein [Oscillibacter sp.]